MLIFMPDTTKFVFIANFDKNQKKKKKQKLWFC